MKKLLISALSLSVLLAGCGQNNDSNKTINKNVSENKEVKTNDNLSSEEFNTHFKKTLTKFTSSMKEIDIVSNGNDVSEFENSYREIGNNLLKSAEEFKNKIKNENLNQEQKEVSKFLTNNMLATGNLFVDMSTVYPKLLSGELTEDQAISENTNIQEKYTQKYLNSIISEEEFSKYLEKHKIEDDYYNSMVAELNETEDPIEFVKNGKSQLVNHESGDNLKIVKVFKNENTDENGFNEIDNNGFISNLAFVLVEDSNTGEKSLGYFGENINKTDKHIHFLGSVEFTTDTGEQIQPDGGVFETNNKLIKEYNPNVKSKGYGIVKLDYQNEIPKSIEVKISQPQNNDDTNYWGQDITLSLK
ncbi:hypothetical protein EVU91_01520 [Macrococcoides bohemicum]|uniref:hypothetical protein n=1 Tax=Macrococcoides bohemicum TaxID=1903056 RepID=UPI0010594C5B|nr:hypothetical protein [Macrococcus bohemicus]TDL40598.1 hypothetical protein EVU91_01520 [Macrococcus bohemicus]